MIYQDLIDQLKKDFPGYHFEITIFPTGGMLDVNACEECGTTESYHASWRYHNEERNSMDKAVEEIKRKMEGK